MFYRIASSIAAAASSPMGAAPPPLPPRAAAPRGRTRDRGHRVVSARGRVRVGVVAESRRRRRRRRVVMLRRGMEPGGTGAGMARGESVSVCDSGSGGKPAGGARRRRQPRAFLRALALPLPLRLGLRRGVFGGDGAVRGDRRRRRSPGNPRGGRSGRGGPGAPGVPGAGRNPRPGHPPEVRRNVLRGVRARGSGRTREPPRGVLSRVRSARAAPRRARLNLPLLAMELGDVRVVGARTVTCERAVPALVRPGRVTVRVRVVVVVSVGRRGVGGRHRRGSRDRMRNRGGGGDRGGGNRGRGGGDGGRRRRL